MASRPLRATSRRSPAAQKLGRDHLVGLVVLGQKRLHAVELTLERPVESTPRGVRANALRLDDRVEQEDAVTGLRRNTLTPSSAQRASSSFPA